MAARVVYIDLVCVLFFFLYVLTVDPLWYICRKQALFFFLSSLSLSLPPHVFGDKARPAPHLAACTGSVVFFFSVSARSSSPPSALPASTPLVFSFLFGLLASPQLSHRFDRLFLFFFLAPVCGRVRLWLLRLRAQTVAGQSTNNRWCKKKKRPHGHKAWRARSQAGRTIARGNKCGQGEKQNTQPRAHGPLSVASSYCIQRPAREALVMHAKTYAPPPRLR